MSDQSKAPSDNLPAGPRAARELQSVFVAGVKIAVAPVAIALGAALFGIDVSWMCALLALLLYSVAAPVLAFQCRSFWLGALVAFATWFGMFTLLVAVANAIGQQRSGEGAMVLLLPMMVFPFLLGLIGLVRFVQWIAPSADAPKPPVHMPPEGEGEAQLLAQRKQ